MLKLHDDARRFGIILDLDLQRVNARYQIQRTNAMAVVKRSNGL